MRAEGREAPAPGFPASFFSLGPTASACAHHPAFPLGLEMEAAPQTPSSSPLTNFPSG